MPQNWEIGHPRTLLSQTRTIKSARSVLIRADDLAAGSRRQLLVDAHLGACCQRVNAVAVGHACRVAGRSRYTPTS